MSPWLQQVISLDLPALIAALCASLSCALLGNFLVLRRQALLGDAISHAVLPGIVIAFLVTFSRTTLPVFLGAFIAGLAAVVCIELIRVFARADSGAAMGVVFSLFFALGVVLIESAAARNVDLDAECLLHGQMETIFFVAPESYAELFRIATLNELPIEVYVAFIVLVVSYIFVWLFFKELVVSSFDPLLSANVGVPPLLMHMLLMTAVAAAVVASFEIVGSILVIAMIICPPAAARLYTDRLKVQILLSQLFTAISVILGYVLATRFEVITGISVSLNAAGMMATCSGFVVLFSVFFAPEYGYVGRTIRVLRLRARVCREDILGLLYRAEEVQGVGAEVDVATLRTVAGAMSSLAVRQLLRKGLVQFSPARQVLLTASGRELGRSFVRNHRLWELFLVHRAGLDPDHVHAPAEHLEHFGSEISVDSLQTKGIDVAQDPHGKEIPND